MRRPRALTYLRRLRRSRKPARQRPLQLPSRRLPRPNPLAALHVLPPRARLAAVGMLVTLLALGGAYLWLRDSSLVSVDRVRVSGVSGDNAHQISKRLRAAALGMTTLNVDDDALRAAVAAFPEVRAVRTEPDFPHKLRIVVSERVAVGVLQSGSRRVAVASDGTLLPQEATTKLPTVPVGALPAGSRLTDAATLRNIEVLAAAPASLRGRVDQLAKGKGGLRATLRGGGTVVLGSPTALTAKWLAAAQVLRDPSARGARYLDVRIPGRPVAGGLPAPPDPTMQDGSNPTTDPLSNTGSGPASDPLSTSTGDPNADPTATGSSAQDGQFAGASP
jgi:cell division protein FtsQ